MAYTFRYAIIVYDIDNNEIETIDNLTIDQLAYQRDLAINHDLPYRLIKIEDNRIKDFEGWG